MSGEHILETQLSQQIYCRDRHTLRGGFDLPKRRLTMGYCLSAPNIGASMWNRGTARAAHLLVTGEARPGVLVAAVSSAMDCFGALACTRKEAP